MTEYRPPQDPSANVILLFEKLETHFETQLTMTRDFLEKRMLTEAGRVDACRRDDTEAVKIAQVVSAKQAGDLATQMARNAEILRDSTAKMAETLAVQLQQGMLSLDTRLKIVEEKQYILAGTSKGRGDMWGWVAFGIMFIVGVVGFIFK